MNNNDKAALLKMAELWEKQADEAERQERASSKWCDPYWRFAGRFTAYFPDPELRLALDIEW